MKVDLDLEINEKSFNELKEEAKENSLEFVNEMGYEREDELRLNNSTLEIGTAEFDKSEDKLFIDGTLKYGGKEYGFVSLNINIDIDIALNIIESYMKKLGKLKTVLEATK